MVGTNEHPYWLHTVRVRKYTQYAYKYEVISGRIYIMISSPKKDNAADIFLNCLALLIT